MVLAEGEGFEPPWGKSPPLISSQGRLASSGIPPTQPGL